MTERWVKYTDQNNIIRWVNMSHATWVGPGIGARDDHEAVVSLLMDSSGLDVILAKEPPEHFLPAEPVASDEEIHQFHLRRERKEN